MPRYLSIGTNFQSPLIKAIFCDGRKRDMKKILKVFIAATFVLTGIIFISSDASARGYKSLNNYPKSTSSNSYPKRTPAPQYRVQQGYNRSNGTYVQPHYKSKPDGIKNNNIGCMNGTSPCY